MNFHRKKKYYLDLGDLVATAKVKVNGKYIGGVWTYPYRVDVSGFLKQGNNAIGVEVINTWKNRNVSFIRGSIHGMVMTRYRSQGY